MDKVYGVFIELHNEVDYEIPDELIVAGIFSDLEKAKKAANVVADEYEDDSPYGDVWSVISTLVKEFTIDSYDDSKSLYDIKFNSLKKQLF